MSIERREDMAGIHQMCAIFLCCVLLSVTQGNDQLDTRCPQGQAYESGTGRCMDCADLCSWGAEGLVSAKLCESDNCAEYRKNKQNGQKPKLDGDHDNLCQGEMRVKMPVHPSTLPLWVTVSIAVVVTCFITVAITLLIVRYFARKGKYLFTKGKKGEQVDQNVSGRLITNSTSDEVEASV